MIANNAGFTLFGCCGYHYSIVQGMLISALAVADTEEEADNFLKLGEEQDKLFQGKIKGATFKVKVGNKWLVNYSLPTSDPAKFADPVLLFSEPAKLVKKTNWALQPASFKRLPLVALMGGSETYPVQELPITQITGFGTNYEVYKEQLKYMLLHGNKAIKLFGLTFASAADQWVVEEAEELANKYKILVDVSWHNPRYRMDDKAHDLRTIIFERS